MASFRDSDKIPAVALNMAVGLTLKYKIIFEKADNFQGLAGKVMGTPVNLKFREIVNVEKMTVLGDVTEELMESLAPMNPVSKIYKAGLS